MSVIRDPSSNKGMEVDSDGYGRVATKAGSYLHWYSEHKEQAYIATFSNISFDTANANERVAYIQNTSETQLLSIDEIRVQVADPGATVPIYTTYVDLVSGLTFSAAGEGAAVTPRNLNLASGKDAAATCYDENITVTGTAVELDRHIVEADSKPFFLGPNKETGALLLGQNDTATVRYESATSVAYIYVTITFHFEA